MITFNSNAILLWGDSHSVPSILSRINRKELNNFQILHLGDVGLGFRLLEKDEKDLHNINESCRERNIILYLLRGNHDDPDFWTKRKYSFSNLFLVPDYTEAEFPNGKTALLVGGGVSIDRFARKSGIDYWPNEITPYKKMEKKFNYLFSHDAPDYFNHSTGSLRTSPFSAFLKVDRDLEADALRQRQTIDMIVEDINPEKIISGHFHNRVQEEKFGIKYRCLDIDEII